MKKTIFLQIIIILFLGINVDNLSAQNPSLSLDNISDNTDFQEKYEKAENYLMEKNYIYALQLYKELDAISPRNANINYKIGICYLHSLSEKNKAIPYFELAAKNASELYAGDYDELTAPLDVYFYLGKAYHIDYKFDLSVKSYKKFEEYVIDSELAEELERHIQMSYNAIEIVNNPLSIKIENLGKNVNTEFSEYSPVIAFSSSNEPALVFTSRRAGSTGEKLDHQGRYFEDIYITYKNTSDDWIPAINIGSKINTNSHEATISMSHDGNQLFIYKDDNGDGNIYVSDFEDGDWTKPRGLNKEVNSEHWETHACLAPDGKTLYFTSNRPGGYGGRDIYKAILSSSGKWINIENLGPTINTPQDEDAPYILADGVTLYFASNGHKTMGGFDIFFSTIDETGFWSDPENIGYPINTTEDDVFYFPTPDEKHAFYSSAKNNGFGELDLYYLTIVKGKESMVTLSGKIADLKTKKEIDVAELVVRDVTKRDFIKTIEIQPENNGEYSLEVPRGRKYVLEASAENYKPNTESIEIDEALRIKDFTKDVFLEKTELAVLIDTVEKSEIGESITLKNIFFDFDKSSLRKESIAELENLYQILIKYPNLKIEICGHTDSYGPDEYNKRLSQARTEVVVDWLIKKGINKNRLIAKGYGEDKPIATNDTKEGRQLNRRTEFKILDK